MNSPSVVFDGSTYQLYYDSYGTSGGGQCASGAHKWPTGIGYATSQDGQTWTKHGELITLADLGALGDFDVGFPVAAHANGKFEMFFRAEDAAHVHRVVCATSSNGTTWTIHGPIGIEAVPGGLVRTGPDPYQLFYGCAVGGNAGRCIARKQSSARQRTLVWTWPQ